jgi:prepilin-type N-terminal cleavage/methylation domain-containing protein
LGITGHASRISLHAPRNTERAAGCIHGIDALQSCAGARRGVCSAHVEKRRMDARGVTLLELIVALGIVGLVAGMGLWEARAWQPELRLAAAVRQLVVDLRRTRAQAVRDHVARRLLFAPDADRYRPQRRPDTTYEDAGDEIALPQTVDLVDCSAPGNAIAFSPRGLATTFGTITLRSAGGRERRVIVDIVGRVRVQ